MAKVLAKVLVVGSGGREHALAWKVATSPKVATVYCDGIATQYNEKVKALPATCPPPTKDFAGLAGWCLAEKIDLVVVGPEVPLVAGIVDVLADAGVRVFGPRSGPAQLEGSKHYAHEFMARHQIHTSQWQAFSDPEAACAHIDTAEYPALVVKACGLAAGKGVIVAEDKDAAKAAVRDVLGGQFGDAGATVVIEELLVGPEVTVFAMTDGSNVQCFLPAQDHKRLEDGDKGPNTGGMGAYSPVPFVSAAEAEAVKTQVAQKVVDGMRAEGTPYKGLLYCQVMLTATGPRVVEFNARFGDPETQGCLRLLKSDLYDALSACADGPALATMPPFKLEFAEGASVATVVMASPGYPEQYPKGLAISGLEDAAGMDGVAVFHAGTKLLQDGKTVATAGGRVLAVTAVGATITEALAKAYTAVSVIAFEGAQFRTDIAQQALEATAEKGATEGEAGPWKATLSAVLQALAEGRPARAAAAGGAAGAAAEVAGMTYADAGVDIAAGDSLVARIKPVCKATKRSGCDAAIGGFGGVFDLKAAGFKDPILISGTDGVGTKLEVAKQVGDHSTIGIDLVAMCVNDILAHGAEPLFFLDYFATGKLNVEEAAQVVEGVGVGCLQSGCALVGGETAEMPGMYKPGDYDVAGFCVGAVERGGVLPRMDEIADGDVIIGLQSAGVHSNGYSLVRRVVAASGLAYDAAAPYPTPEAGQTLGKSLLTPTRLYVKPVLACIKATRGVRAYAHITGGGLTENIPRILPDGFGVDIDAAAWEMPAVFRWVRAQGNVAPSEMARTFNCGIGGIVIVAPDQAEVAAEALKAAGEVGCTVIGRIVKRSATQDRVHIRNLKEVLDNTDGITVAATPAAAARKRTAVLISGSGTGLQSLIDATQRKSPAHPAEIVLVISNVPGAKGLERAERSGVANVLTIDHKAYKGREAFEAAVHAALVANRIDIVCLAGFMRILTASFVDQWAGKLVNIHPSLLPSFKGHDAHAQVLAAGVKVTGCTVHYVDSGVDTGKIIAQECTTVEDGDTEATLSERVKSVEHKLYPKALALLAASV